MKIRIDGVDHDWVADKVTFAEAEAVERAFGGTYTKWLAALDDGSMLARRLLVWLLLRRQKPDMRLAELDGTTIDVAEATPDEEPGPTGPVEAEPSPAAA